MPFLGRDWRGPGCNWSKAGTSSWEISDHNIGVVLESIPRNHVKKIIEAFLRQMQQKKNRSLYTNLSSAPVSRCSVRQDLTWLQVGLKGSKEIHGYTTLGEMIRRLDLAGAASISYRFPYILEIADLLVREKMYNLSGTAQSQLFVLINSLLSQVMSTQRGIRQMHEILNKLMTFLLQQSKKSMFSSKSYWLNNIAQVRQWKKELKLIKVPQRLDSQATLSDLPVEVQRKIVTCLRDGSDVICVSRVNSTLRSITEETSTWRKLCQNNFTEEQIKSAKTMLWKKSMRQVKECERVDKSPPCYVDRNYLNPSSTAEWKDIYSWLRRTYAKQEFSYIDPLLYCKSCSVLYWEASGHPCISAVHNVKPDILELTPRQLVSFFEV